MGESEKMKGKIKHGSIGWTSSDSEDDQKKNVSSDEEDLQKAVQDLGLQVLDCEQGKHHRSGQRQMTRKSRSKSLTNITKRALISILPSKKDKTKEIFENFFLAKT